MDVKTKKKIGHGAMGSVYLAEAGGKKCIVKIEKACPNFERGNRAYDRQVVFAEWLADQPIKNKFLTLKSHGWINNCKNRVPIPKWADAESRKRFEQKNNLSTCYYLIYTPVLSQTLGEALKGKSFREYAAIIKSMLRQIVPPIIYMNDHGYSHRDLHKGNIMRNKSWYIIDYGLVKNKRWPNNADDKHANNSDFIALAELAVHSPIKMAAWDENKFKPRSFISVVGAIKKTPAYAEIKKMIGKKHHDSMVELLCEVYHFDTFRKAFGAPKKMEIPPSRLCISDAKFKELLAPLLVKQALSAR